MKATASRTNSASILVCVLMSLVIGRAIAQTQEIRLEELTKKAEVIVVGKISNVKSEWNNEKTRIYTKVTVDVGEYVKGETPARTLVITQLGGEVDGVGELYTHTARFSKEEEVLLFVKKDSKSNLIVAGGDEGKYVVTKDKSTGERMVQGLALKVFSAKVKRIVEQQMIK